MRLAMYLRSSIGIGGIDETEASGPLGVIPIGHVFDPVLILNFQVLAVASAMFSAVAPAMSWRSMKIGMLQPLPSLLQGVGLMFWLTRNKFCGSNLALTAASRLALPR